MPLLNFNRRPVVKISRKKRKNARRPQLQRDLRHTSHALISLISRGAYQPMHHYLGILSHIAVNCLLSLVGIGSGIYIALGHVRHLRVVLAYSVEPLPVSDQWRDFPFFAFQPKDQKYIFHVLSFRFSSYFPRVARFAFS